MLSKWLIKCFKESSSPTSLRRGGLTFSTSIIGVVCGAMASQEDEKVSLGRASQDVASKDLTTERSVARDESRPQTWLDRITFFLTKWGVETNGYFLMGHPSH